MTAPTPPRGSGPSGLHLALLALLSGAVAAWSYVLLRAQNAPESLGAICREGGGCASLWTAPFALSVQRVTSVPVAGWGIVWGLAALGLALFAWLRLARGQAADAAVTALRFTSGAGLVGVFVLVGVVITERSFCGACAIAHALVLAHAVIAVFVWRTRRVPQAGPATVLAGGSMLWAYLVVVFAASSIPKSTIPVASAPDASADAKLREFLGTLTPPARQALSDALGNMRRGPALTLPKPRVLSGKPDAPVRFTQWTDVRCSHCADLNRTWKELEKTLPGSFSLESRYYPLDIACNPAMKNPQRDEVRCLAPRVQICREGYPDADLLKDALYSQQRELTPARVYELATGSRAALEACVASAETQAKLESDLALAAQYHADGTPIVVVNGRPGSAMPIFLYAITLAQGSPDHPAFASLPPANPNAHVH
jgi:serine/threonine-protein kinase